MPLILNGSTGVLDGLMVSSSNLTSDAVYLTAPAGAVCFVAQNTAPTGWLKANGAAVSRTTYSALFTALGTTFGSGNGSTTFNLPDLRGEFPRGWDDSRGADSGRAIGSAQAAAFASHSHTASDSGHAHQLRMAGSGDNNNLWHRAIDNIKPASGDGGWNCTDYGSAGSINTGYANISVGSTGGTETRPRNIALLAIIKF